MPFTVVRRSTHLSSHLSHTRLRTLLFLLRPLFGFTLYVILPLSFIKEVKFNSKRQEGRGQDKPLVLLAVGVSQRLAFNVLKQYSEEKDMFIVVAAAFGWWTLTSLGRVSRRVRHWASWISNMDCFRIFWSLAGHTCRGRTIYFCGCLYSHTFRTFMGALALF